MACVRTCSTLAVLRKRKHEVERKAVLIAQRDDDAVVRGGGLELEIERATETLAQRETPRPIDPGTKGCVQHELHAAALVEEPLGHDDGFRRQSPERRRTSTDVVNSLLGAGTVEAALGRHERDGLVSPLGATIAAPAGNLLPDARNFSRQLHRPAGCLTPPERDRRRRAVRVLDPNAAGLDAPDSSTTSFPGGRRLR